MHETEIKHSSYGLEHHGLYNPNDIYWNLPTPALCEQALERREGALSHPGPLVARTGHHTGRSANDKFIVDESESHDQIWWGTINKPIPEQNFDILHQRMASCLQMKDVYVQDCFAGANPDYRMPIRIITEYAWHNLFARNLFIQAKPGELDEHGWSDNGIFNFEGGCYAKMIKLSPENEPEIYSTTQRFGTVLENVTLQSHDRWLDLDDDSLTENTRGAYHISAIPNATLDGIGDHPENIIFLTCDAFGVMPPVSRLTPEQAMYHFISGYTARVAGTEKGVTEPSPVFSACYGAPFMPLHPRRYAELLGERIMRHGAKVWLINTGWSGGPYGVGERFAIPHTRAMVNAALNGDLDEVPTWRDPVFGFEVPESCPGVPDKLLKPRETWSDPAAYDAQATKLAEMFRENFADYADEVPDNINAAGPA